MLTTRQKEYINNLSTEVASKPVVIYPWEENGLDVAESVIKDIHSIEPNLEVFLMGSTPLKIAGQKDIDMTSVDSASKFEFHKEKPGRIFGKPSVENESSIVWHFIKNGYEIGFYIVDSIKSD